MTQLRGRKWALCCDADGCKAERTYSYSTRDDEMRRDAKAHGWARRRQAIPRGQELYRFYRYKDLCPKCDPKRTGGGAA